MPAKKKSSARKSRSSRSRSANDPFTQLIKEHRQALALFRRIENLPEDAEEECDRMFDELKMALSRHMAMEENLLYPTLKASPATQELTFEAIEEHGVCKTLLEELDTDGLTPEVWMAKFTVLRENVEHHVEEEEGEMMPKARRALSAEEKDELKQAMADFVAETERTAAAIEESGISE